MSMLELYARWYREAEQRWEGEPDDVKARYVREDYVDREVRQQWKQYLDSEINRLVTEVSR